MANNDTATPVPAPAPPEPAGEDRFNESAFRQRLMDEYKMLQEKLDKIGGFRSAIKGWSVTAVVAVAVASATAKTSSLSSLITISVGLAILLWSFFRLEYQQVSLSLIFGARAGKIEDVYRALDRPSGLPTWERIPVPFTAHEIVQVRANVVWERRRGRRRILHRIAESWRAYKQADFKFYLILILLAFALPIAPHYRCLWVRIQNFYSADSRTTPHMAQLRQDPCE